MSAFRSPIASHSTEQRTHHTFIEEKKLVLPLVIELKVSITHYSYWMGGGGCENNEALHAHKEREREREGRTLPVCAYMIKYMPTASQSIIG